MRSIEKRNIWLPRPAQDELPGQTATEDSTGPSEERDGAPADQRRAGSSAVARTGRGSNDGSFVRNVEIAKGRSALPGKIVPSQESFRT